MLYRLRTETGEATRFSAGTFSPREGTPQPIRWTEVRLDQTAFWKSARSGARYPARWRITVATLGLELEVEPQVADQELVTEQSTGVVYWEGTCRVTGRRGGNPVTGRAYVELTGYARRAVPGLCQAARAVADATGAAGIYLLRGQGRLRVETVFQGVGVGLGAF
jgi:predicted secreted hydrolase